MQIVYRVHRNINLLFYKIKWEDRATLKIKYQALNHTHN